MTLQDHIIHMRTFEKHEANSQILSPAVILHASGETWLHLNQDVLCPMYAVPSVKQLQHAKAKKSVELKQRNIST